MGVGGSGSLGLEKGKFIAFEGIDGSGESTQVVRLKDYLVSKHRIVHVTKEPTGETIDENAIGKLIRDTLGHKVKLDPFSLQLLFSSDRKQHLTDIIIPKIDEGFDVITDRYRGSTLAYGHRMGEEIYHVLKIINDLYLKPDLEFYIKVSAKTAMERIAKRGKPEELFEKKQSLEKSLLGYEQYYKDYSRIFVLNGEKSVDDVFSDMKESVDMFYGF